MVHLDAQSLRDREDVYEWYTTEIDSIPPAMRRLLEEHSGLSPDRVIPHIAEVVRRRLVHQTGLDASEDLPSIPLACVVADPRPRFSSLRFLNLNLSANPHYGDILHRLTTQSETLLDAGCCFGQDLRKLVFDGVPPRSLYGLDVEPSFLELGCDLFCDRDRMAEATFVSGNLLKDGDENADTSANPGGGLSQLQGSIDVIHASSLLHLFTWEEQVRAASRLVGFTKAKAGCMILGRQVGALEAGEYRGLHEGSSSFRHNVETFQRLWAEVGQMTGSKWKVDAQMDLEDVTPGVNLGQKWMEAGTRRLHFVIIRE
ncbi:MAG: hypothetical protein Q9160_008806 [Pyrenula sp. 1 TL-2023]